MCDPQVPINAECFQENPAKPYCVSENDCGDCLALTTKDCIDIDPHKPACPESGGLCVECTATNLKACSSKQVCNQYLNDCGSCFEHEQCASGACNLFQGLCFPVESKVVWVNNKFPCTKPDGSQGKPYCEIAEAFEENLSIDLIIKVKPHGVPYKAPILVEGGINAAILGVLENASDPRPLFQDSQSQSTLLNLEGNSTLFLDNIAVDGSSQVTSSTIKCWGSFLWITHSSISKNANPIESDTCHIVLERTVFSDNNGGSNITGGTFTLLNSFITGNNAGVLGTPFRVSAAVDVRYTTILANSGSSSTGISCVSGNFAIVRNSILLGQPDVIVGCTYNDVLQDKEGTYEGLPNEINSLFQAPIKGTYRPKPAADAISNLAVWRPDDPFVDYFGEHRPNIPEELDFAGAAHP